MHWVIYLSRENPIINNMIEFPLAGREIAKKISIIGEDFRETKGLLLYYSVGFYTCHLGFGFCYAILKYTAIKMLD